MRIILALTCLLLAQLACGLSALDISLARKAQKQQHHDIIRTLQPRVDQRQPVPSSQLLFLAGAYAETRDYARLFPTLELLQTQTEHGDANMFGGDLTALPHFMRAGAWLDLGDPGRALQEASAADAILARQTLASNNFLANFQIETWGPLGVAQALLGHPAEARACIRRLRAIEIGNSINGPHKFAGIARIHMALGEFAEALAAIRDPGAAFHGLATLFYDNTFQTVPLVYMQAKCLLETGNRDEARADYDQLLQLPRLAEVGGLHWPVLLDRARIALLDGQPAMAEDLLRRAVTVIEGQRASIGSEAGRIGFVADKQAPYQELVALLATAGRAPEAFAYVERAKGRALVDLLASQKQLGRPGQDSAQALDRLARTEQELRAIPDPEAPSQRGVLVTARQELAVRAPELASLVIVPDVRAADLQARLGADETLLEYYAAGDRWLAFVATRATLTVQPLATGDLAAKVRELRRCLGDPALPAAAACAELNRILLEPVAGQLRTPRLTIVPHGILHYVPFAALGPADAALIDRCSLRILPSASLLAFLRPRRGAGGSLILGNPDLGRADLDLPFAQAEAEALAGILPGPVLRVGRAATAEAVLDSAGRYGIIHLAAHGTFDPGQPLASAILLAPTARAPGALTVADLYRLDLDTDLFTLSACETALASVSRGDDVVGFTRGLLFAGSRSVLSSLWKVDDQCTRDLMVDFYGCLGRMGKAEALVHAQRAVRAGHPHPYYWAAFLLAGSAD